MRTFVTAATALLLVALISSKAQAELRFGTPTPLPAPINDEWLNWKPTISSDNLTIFWASNRPGLGDLDIWTSSRLSVTSPWGPAISVGASINSSASESEPSISADGLELYFARGTSGLRRDSYDIWVAKRASITDPWGDAEKLGTTLNSPSEDADPSISTDGLELYFDSNRSRSFKIYVSRRESKDAPFGVPEVVLESTGYANISPNGLLLFSSLTPDLAVSKRATPNDPFGIPALLSDINTPTFDEFDGVLSSDGKTLYFTSNRPGVPTGQQFGEVGLWQAQVVPELGSIWLTLTALTAIGTRRRRVTTVNPSRPPLASFGMGRPI